MQHGGEVDQELHEALGASQRLGLLGDRPIGAVIDHARAFVSALAEVSGTVIDLGSGGGVPGLVIAFDRPDLQVTLLDRRTKRTDFLSRMVRRYEWTEHVAVIAADVDELLRADVPRFDAVVARSFGSPETTLGIAVRLVAVDGLIVISEPPSGDRWDPDLLHRLGVERRPSESRVACFTPM